MLINWYSNAGQGRGYSGASENIIIELEDLGFDVRLISPNKIIRENLTPKGRAIVDKPFKLGRVGIYFGYPNGFTSVLNEIKIGFTMFETDRLPNGVGRGNERNDWAGPSGRASDIINSMDELWVPSEQNIEVFKQDGVTVPINKVRLGVNKELFFDMSKRRIETRGSRPFTFLMLGTLTSRKNVGAAIAAFMALFSKRPDVKLLLKSSSGTLAAIQFPDDVNIEIIDEYSTLEQMEKYYAESDAFIFPSRGEGFGLPPLEAMATGLPTIFADNTGMSEYADKLYNFPIKSDKKVPANRFPIKWGNVGNWYEVDMFDLQANMLYVVENQDKAIAKGRAAAKWVAENWTYKNTAQTIAKHLEKYAL